MTQRAWIATRKGLFELNRSRDDWSIGRASFLGEPVSMVLPPDRLGADARGAQPRPLRRESACERRRRRHLARGRDADLPAAARGRTRSGVEARADLVVAAPRRHGMGRHACPAACSARAMRGAVVAARRVAVEPAGAHRVVRRRLRRARHPFDLPAPGAHRRAAGRRQLRRRVGHARRRQQLGAAGQGHAR